MPTYSGAYIEFTTLQAATAVKQKIEQFSEGQPAARKHIVAFASPTTNPYKTTPKDNRGSQNGSVTGGGNSSGYDSGRGGRGGYNNGGFRGRGGMGGRGGMNNQNMNRNFGGPPAMNGMAGGFQGPMAGGFAGAMGGMAGFNNFAQNGMMGMGGMGGMRGGGNRGGFNNFNRGGMMGMGGMSMGGNMAMPMMGGMPAS